MALYDGFFDAVQDETSGEYDRAYSSGDFTGYFANVIGSGVCVHDNPDSFKAEYEDGTLYLRPGYLFIQGYWLANKAGEGEPNYKGYAVTLPSGMTGSMAVVAHLNMGQRLIEIKVQPVSQAYPDALVLAIITTSTAEDTRHNTDICGVIDTAGALSSQVEWALNYIDTEIESKLQQVEADIAAQDVKLTAKIAEVQAVVDSIVPPPVGSIKFSASQDVGPEWLQCNGDFISENQYPELVAALGKLTPSGDKFELLSSGEIGPQISNGVVYGGRMWVYSYSTKKLYGVDLAGTAAVKEITVASEDTHFNGFLQPTTTRPIALSIVPHKVGTGAKLFLTQIVGDGAIGVENEENYDYTNIFLIFECEFDGTESGISVVAPFAKVEYVYENAIYVEPDCCVPYVISKMESGAEKYICCVSSTDGNNRDLAGYKYIDWLDGDSEAKTSSGTAKNLIDNGAGGSSGANNAFYYQRSAFSHKNLDECVTVRSYKDQYSSTITSYSVNSGLSSTFKISSGTISENVKGRQSMLPLNIAGASKILSAFDVHLFPSVSIVKTEFTVVDPGISLPSAARVFVDAGAYLWGKDIYMIFVGTGVIFSRTLEEGSFGYLDTTSVLGTITQFGYLDYSQDEGTLYLLGQDTTNTVKVAKIVLNTLYDYANDGAWLPMIAADGVPAWIKAKEAVS